MEYQMKNIFIEKSYRKCAAKASKKNHVQARACQVKNQKQPLHAGNSFKSKIF